MTLLHYDIVMIPDADISGDISILSQQLTKKGTYFTLKDGEYYPHLSLYMVQIDTNKVPELENRLSKIAMRTPPITLTPYEYHQESGYLDIEYAREPLSVQLQIDIINAINPIRDGLREKDKARLDYVVGKERENIETYGYRSIGELFSPHITLTRFVNEQAIDLAELPNIVRYQTTFSKLGIFELGENGTCVKRIAEFKLY